MFRDEGDGDDDERGFGFSGALNFFVCGGADPFQGADAALVAQDPIQIRDGEFVHNGACGLGAVRGVGVACADDFFREAVGGEENARRYGVVGAGCGVGGAGEAGEGGDEVGGGGVGGDGYYFERVRLFL